MPASQKHRAYSVLESPLGVAATGLEVSPGSLLQDGVIQRQVGNQLLEAGIFFLELFKFPGLLYPHTAVFLTPSIIGLFGDADLTAGFAYAASLAEKNLSFPEFVDDLFRSVTLFDYVPPFL
jgi:hypothetical protein